MQTPPPSVSPNEFLEKHLFEVNFKDKESTLENNDNNTKKENIAFCNNTTWLY